MSLSLRLLLIAAAIGATVIAATLSTPSFGDSATCVRVMPLPGGRERLVNQCNMCRQATVMRSRVSTSAPMTRQFSLRARSTFELPFLGPGRTRITNDTACRGTKQAPPNIAAETKKAAAPQKCVRLMRVDNTATGGSGIELVNGCNSCRKVAVRKIGAKLERYQDQAFALPPGKAKPVSADGYAHVAVIADVACF